VTRRALVIGSAVVNVLSVCAYLAFDRMAIVWEMSFASYGCLVALGLTFSLAQGIIHPYYAVALAPPLGGLVGMGVFSLWERRSTWTARGTVHLIAASDLVISTAGKSTIDECVSSGTPMIAIPIKNHVEQERNAAELGFAFGDLDRLDQLIPKLLGKRSEPANYVGAQRTADYLASLLPES